MQAPLRLLIISYYWPPDEGTGVNRIVKMAHYLSKLGWHITVLTATSRSADQDHDAGFTVVREPGVKLTKLWGSTQSPAPREDGFRSSLFYKKNKTLRERLLIWARLHLLVPDAKIGWYHGAVQRGKKLLQAQPYDALLSTAPPPTTALVARALARFSKIPWTADFRDPWTQIYYYEAFPPGALAGWVNRRLEDKVIHDAQELVVVNSGFFPQPSSPMASIRAILPLLHLAWGQRKNRLICISSTWVPSK